jgi:hypothetical protein
MIVGINRPASPAWALVGVGALFDTNPADLNNGRPGDVTAVKWLSGAQTTASVLKLQQTWAIAQTVRVIPILGLKGIPVGTKIIVTGQRAGDPVGTFPYALGGNSATQRTVQFADGSIGAWIICAVGNDPLVGYQVAVYNDVAGATVFAAGQYIYPGEIDAFYGWQVPAGIKKDWPPAFDGLPPERRGDNQPRPLITLPYTVQQITLANVPYDVAYGNAGAPTAVDYDMLSKILNAGDSCCVIPRWKDSTGALDVWAVHKTAVFGVARNVQPPRHTGNNRYEMSFSVAQAPAGN